MLYPCDVNNSAIFKDFEGYTGQPSFVLWARKDFGRWRDSRVKVSLYKLVFMSTRSQHNDGATRSRGKHLYIPAGAAVLSCMVWPNFEGHPSIHPSDVMHTPPPGGVYDGSSWFSDPGRPLVGPGMVSRPWVHVANAFVDAAHPATSRGAWAGTDVSRRYLAEEIDLLRLCCWVRGRAGRLRVTLYRTLVVGTKESHKTEAT